MPGQHYKRCIYLDSVHGNDANHGSKEEPVQTPDRARHILQAMEKCPGVFIVNKDERKAMAEFICGERLCQMCKFVNAKKLCPNCNEIISNRTPAHGACGWQESQEEKRDKKAKSVQPRPSMTHSKTPTQLLHSAAQNLNALTEKYGGSWLLVARTNRGGPGGFSKCWQLGSHQNGIVAVGEANDVMWRKTSTNKLLLPEGVPDPDNTKTQALEAFDSLTQSFLSEMRRETGRGKTSSNSKTTYVSLPSTRVAKPGEIHEYGFVTDPAPAYMAHPANMPVSDPPMSEALPHHHHHHHHHHPHLEQQLGAPAPRAVALPTHLPGYHEVAHHLDDRPPMPKRRKPDTMPHGGPH